MAEKKTIEIKMTIDISDFFDMTEEELTLLETEKKFPAWVQKSILATLSKRAERNSFSDDDVYITAREDGELIYDNYGRMQV